MTNLDSILKSRDITLPTKVRLVKAMVFPVVMYGCESWICECSTCESHFHKESWVPKNQCFWTVLLEKTLESPLDCKEIQPVHQEDQSWVFIGRTDVEAETPILWPPKAKSQLTGKDPDAGKDWGQEEKGTTEDEMVGWHHWLNGHEFVWTLGVGDGQGGLDAVVHGVTESQTWLTELNWTEQWPNWYTWNTSFCVLFSYSRTRHCSLCTKASTSKCIWPFVKIYPIPCIQENFGMHSLNSVHLFCSFGQKFLVCPSIMTFQPSILFLPLGGCLLGFNNWAPVSTGFQYFDHWGFWFSLQFRSCSRESLRYFQGDEFLKFSNYVAIYQCHIYLFIFPFHLFLLVVG